MASLELKLMQYGATDVDNLTMSPSFPEPMTGRGLDPSSSFPDQ